MTLLLWLASIRAEVFLVVAAMTGAVGALAVVHAIQTWRAHR